jgi:hypothetical protein
VKIRKIFTYAFCKSGVLHCGPCQLGKQTRTAHKKTSGILTSRNLELLHMDLMGPTRTASLGGRKYILVVVDDYSRFTWAIVLREKSDACCGNIYLNK